VTDYTFGGGDTIAVNPATGLIQPNGTLTPYAITDPSHTTPLIVRSPTGISMTSISTGPLGHVEEFVHDQPRLRLVSAGVEVIVTSVDGIIADAAAAREAAETAEERVREYIAGGGGGGGGTGTPGVTRHSLLSHLDADDHTQYLTSVRGDARYHTKTLVEQLVATAISASSVEDRKRENHSGAMPASAVLGLEAEVAAFVDDRMTEAGYAPVKIVDSLGSVPPGLTRPTVVVIRGSAVGGVDTTPPTVPTGLAVANVTATSADLSWTASTDAVGVAGYRIYLGGSLWTTSTGTSAALTGLSPSTTYAVTVRARDAAGNESGPSTALSLTTPAAPTVTSPTVVGTTQRTEVTTSTLGTYELGVGPMSLTTGDLLLVTVVQTGYTGVTAPAGWTTVVSSQAMGSRRMFVFSRVRQSGDGDSYTFTTEGTAGQGRAALVAVRGTSGTYTAGTVGARSSTGTSTTTVAPGVAALVGDLVLTISAEATSAADTVAPTVTAGGATTLLWTGEVSAGTGSPIETVFFATRAITTAGTTDPVTVTYQNAQTSNGASLQVAIHAVP